MNPDEAYLILRMLSLSYWDLDTIRTLSEIIEVAESHLNAIDWEEVDKMFMCWFKTYCWDYIDRNLLYAMVK